MGILQDKKSDYGMQSALDLQQISGETIELDVDVINSKILAQEI